MMVPSCYLAGVVPFIYVYVDVGTHRPHFGLPLVSMRSHKNTSGKLAELHLPSNPQGRVPGTSTPNDAES